MREEWRDENNKGVAILRVSSARQKDNFSHDVQEKDIREYCERNRIEIVAIYKIVESAKDSENRKKFAAALNSALAENYRHILFYMFDRESRNLTDNEANEKLVKAGVIVIHYVRENKVLYKGSPDSDFFMRDVQAAANKQFIRNLMAKVSDGMREKAQQGWYPSNKPPLGYVTQPLKDENGRPLKRGTVIVRDPDENTVNQVVREFELRSQGYSFEQIRQKVLNEGLVHPKRVSAYRKCTIDWRLRNPFYWGSFIWAGVLYPGKHEIIIPKYLLDRVKAINEGKRVIRPGGKNGIFAGGFIKCECGCNVVYDPKKKVSKNGNVRVYHFYHCSNGKRVHRNLIGMNIREEEIWNQLNQVIDAISITPELAAQIAHEMNDSYRKAASEYRAKIQEYKAALAELDVKEDKAYDNLNLNILDGEGFRRVVHRIRTERVHCTDLLSKAQSDLKGGMRENVQSTIELAKSAKALYLSRSAEERRDFLNLIVSNLILKGSTICFDLKKPFWILAKMNKNEEWRTLIDEFRTHVTAITEF